MSVFAPTRPRRAAQPAAPTLTEPSREGPEKTPSSVDPDSVRAALGAPSRRSVVRTGVWSVPVVAAAVAAPAFAASPAQCGVCSGNRPPLCLLTVGGTTTGTCNCAPGLICVGTGPLGLANVCVGAGVLSQTCGTSPCFGVCISNGGGAFSLINTLLSGVTGLINAVPGCGTTNSGSIPNNICVSPVAANGVGGLGAICLIVNGGGLLGLPLTTLINTLTAGLNALGLGPATTCASPYSCKPGLKLDATGGFCAVANFDLTVGFCQC